MLHNLCFVRRRSSRRYQSSRSLSMPISGRFTGFRVPTRYVAAHAQGPRSQRWSFSCPPTRAEKIVSAVAPTEEDLIRMFERVGEPDVAQMQLADNVLV